MSEPVDAVVQESSNGIHEQIAAIELDPGLASTSATKYRGFEQWLGALLEIDESQIRTVWVDGPGAFTARRGTIASARPRLGVILVGTGLDRITERASELVSETTECVVLVHKRDGIWQVETVIASEGSQLVADLAERLIVPGAQVTVVGAEAPAGNALVDFLPRPAFTQEDCDFLGRYHGSVRWTAVPDDDRQAYHDLRTRLKSLASLVQTAMGPAVQMAAHASMRNVRSYAAKDMWCCVFPQSAPNKSYALQVAFIVSARGAEVCFCLGAGSAMERIEEHREANRAVFVALQARLRELPDRERAFLRDLVDEGWNLRKGWRQANGSVDFGTVEEWLQFAASPEGGGASISRDLTANELEKLGDAICDELVSAARKVLPVFAWVYGEHDPVSFDVQTIVEECSRELSLPSAVYTNLWAALESGKHVILTGPPGTGKTTLAQLVADIAFRARRSTGWVLTTATADWTTYETIGGLRPSENGLQFEEGHFLKAIRERKWLIIDELNRSNFDRAFGQLFTVLSKQPVVLPYTRAGEDEPLTLVPEPRERWTALGGDQLAIPESWRIIATMNVFDKSLLFEMSYALMRRFAFVEVPSPDDSVGGDFQGLIVRAATDEAGHVNEAAVATALDLMKVRRVKDIGPACFIDIARFVSAWPSVPVADDRGALAWHAFYGFLLPQFEGIDERDGKRLYATLRAVVGSARHKELRRTLHSVLGISDFALAPTAADGEGEDETGLEAEE